MNGHKSSSIFCCFLVFFVLMAAGCALSPTLERYGTLPPTVKGAMVVKLSGNELEVVNSGIYLNEGELYSIVAAEIRGEFPLQMFLDFLFLHIRIGQEPYFDPLSGTHYSLNGTTRIAHAHGNLYLALKFSMDPGLVGTLRNVNDLEVLIITWKTDNRTQIVGSLQKLREDAKKSNAHTDFINGFDDAIDRAKKLREDFGFRIPVPPCGIGFAPEIVCVKNYRRVTP